MIPYKIHLDEWTVGMYATDDGRLTITVPHAGDPADYMTRIVGEVRMRRYYIGQQCAGELHASPFPTYRDAKPVSKEALLAAEGAG